MTSRELPAAPRLDPGRDIDIAAAWDGESCGVPLVWGNLVASYGMIGGLIAAYFVMRAVGNYFNLPFWTPLVAVGAGSLLMIFPMIAVTRRLRGRSTSTKGVPAKGDPAFRVRVIADAALAQRVRDEEGAMRREGFEVEVVRPWFGGMPRRETHAVLWPAAVLALAGMWLLDSLTPGRSMFTSLLSLQMFAAFAVGALVAELAWPVYLRVSPGRLDVLRYGFLGLGRMRQQTFDLRTCRVMVNLRARAVVIEPADGLERVRGLRVKRPFKQGIAAERIGGMGMGLALTAGSDAFLWCVLRGAVTEARGEALPAEAWTQ